VDHLEVVLPARIGHHTVAAQLTVIEALVAPKRNDVIELAELGREVAQELAQKLELDGQSVPLVEAHELPELARLHAVIAFLDDHGSSRSATLCVVAVALQPR